MASSICFAVHASVAKMSAEGAILLIENRPLIGLLHVATNPLPQSRYQHECNSGVVMRLEIIYFYSELPIETHW